MSTVRAKKHLGQHFLNDKSAAQKIVEALEPTLGFKHVLEVGPGMGVLSDFLLQKDAYETWLIDVDDESIVFLADKYPQLDNRLIHGDFLTLDFSRFFGDKMAVIGNFPYNISSQILFKILEERQRVVQMVGMFQKEVAERCVAKPGNKEYGILSVFLQAYYDVRYLFTVKAGAFNPPPKVLSGVIKMTRNDRDRLDCDEKLFWRVVKAAFNQRRKTLRNALSAVVPKDRMSNNPLYELRAERLSVEDFVTLTNEIANAIYQNDR
ncbi:16S rRNA (adenine(1518)-N(6)/adenine(1519)-N(6))-dimethyltransferase RsmA [Sphingobacterium chuzhouense]|uniref:Ribosomal RNA small subunit methyltransferase A n=1 Tax=Sphingobacterium chuzhouense TaxID=1742264 RepID=A0ABR7XWZ4_9SPHI|nr:16S rRNA (adenine(1518)-N(6)/adenine(1519)-N(6))-dimethyltransferase RsmA [Sphingobacterium chuzhouense]MBD1423547.1 16S rRNA (adenine(1518)-N(6)/adenine(1519)-N(6))-dimethyltransferase RsmA [Sphingobacterium chuzhouense]